MLAVIVWVFPVMGQQNQDRVKRLDGSAITAAEIDTMVTRVKRADVPGMGLAILNDGKIVQAKGYGLRDTEKHLPSRFRSTQNTAIREECRIALQTREFSNLSATPALNLTHILTETSDFAPFSRVLLSCATVNELRLTAFAPASILRAAFLEIGFAHA